jgi:hypothetical protein
MAPKIYRLVSAHHSSFCSPLTPPHTFYSRHARGPAVQFLQGVTVTLASGPLHVLLLLPSLTPSLRLFCTFSHCWKALRLFYSLFFLRHKFSFSFFYGFYIPPMVNIVGLPFVYLRLFTCSCYPLTWDLALGLWFQWAGGEHIFVAVLCLPTLPSLPYCVKFLHSLL